MRCVIRVIAASSARHLAEASAMKRVFCRLTTAKGNRLVLSPEMHRSLSCLPSRAPSSGTKRLYQKLSTFECHDHKALSRTRICTSTVSLGFTNEHYQIYQAWTFGHIVISQLYISKLRVTIYWRIILYDHSSIQCL